MLTAGHTAPPFALTNQRDEVVELAALGGRDELVYLCPRNTPTRLLEVLAQ
jgi:peroxiredoxin